jgi:hypothetical protein
MIAKTLTLLTLTFLALRIAAAPINVVVPIAQDLAKRSTDDIIVKAFQPVDSQPQRRKTTVKQRTPLAILGQPRLPKQTKPHLQLHAEALLPVSQVAIPPLLLAKESSRDRVLLRRKINFADIIKKIKNGEIRVPAPYSNMNTQIRCLLQLGM